MSGLLSDSADRSEAQIDCWRGVLLLFKERWILYRRATVQKPSIEDHQIDQEPFGTQANAIVGLTGQPFWQDESYDHWVRGLEELEKIVQN